MLKGQTQTKTRTLLSPDEQWFQKVRIAMIGDAHAWFSEGSGTPQARLVRFSGQPTKEGVNTG